MLFVPSDGVFVKPPEDGLAAIDLFMCKVKHSAKLRSLFLYASRGSWKRAPALIPIVKKKKNTHADILTSTYYYMFIYFCVCLKILALIIIEYFISKSSNNLSESKLEEYYSKKTNKIRKVVRYI